MRNVVVLLTVVLVMSVFSSVDAADDCNVMRYVDNLDGTMTDCRSNLIWLKEAKCTATINSIAPSYFGQFDWNDAMQWVKGLKHGICGLTDISDEGFWRLPTVAEWMAMIISAKKQGFTGPTLTSYQGTSKWGDPSVQPQDFQNVQTGSYWSSTTKADEQGRAWVVDMTYGVTSGNKMGLNYVWPVRGGQSGTFGTLTLE